MFLFMVFWAFLRRERKIVVASLLKGANFGDQIVCSVKNGLKMRWFVRVNKVIIKLYKKWEWYNFLFFTNHFYKPLIILKAKKTFPNTLRHIIVHKTKWTIPNFPQITALCRLKWELIEDWRNSVTWWLIPWHLISDVISTPNKAMLYRV